MNFYSHSMSAKCKLAMWIVHYGVVIWSMHCTIFIDDRMGIYNFHPFWIPCWFSNWAYACICACRMKFVVVLHLCVQDEVCYCVYWCASSYFPLIYGTFFSVQDSGVIFLYWQLKLWYFSLNEALINVLRYVLTDVCSWKICWRFFLLKF